MSLTVRQQSTNGPESWYGEPQHETHVGDQTAIEFERYGEPNHEQPSEPPESIEFVSGIEYCQWRPLGESERPMRKRAERPAMRLRMGGISRSSRGVRFAGSSR